MSYVSTQSQQDSFNTHAILDEAIEIVLETGSHHATEKLLPLVENTVRSMLGKYGKIYPVKLQLNLKNHDHGNNTPPGSRVLRLFADNFIKERTEEYIEYIIPKFHHCKESFKEEYTDEYLLFECSEEDFETITHPDCEYIWISYYDHQTRLKHFQIFLLLTKSCVDGYSDIDFDHRYGDHASDAEYMCEEISRSIGRQYRRYGLELSDEEQWELMQDELELCMSELRIHDSDILSDAMYCATIHLDTPNAMLCKTETAPVLLRESNNPQEIIDEVMGMLVDFMNDHPESELQTGSSIVKPSIATDATALSA